MRQATWPSDSLAGLRRSSPAHDRGNVERLFVPLDWLLSSGTLLAQETWSNDTVAAWGAAMCQMIVEYQHDRPLRVVNVRRVCVVADDRDLLPA